MPDTTTIGKESKEICIRFWHRIYHIERKGIYSHAEISKLLKDIERIRHLVINQGFLTHCLDKFYNNPDADLMKRHVMITELRNVFHRPLRDIGQDPYTKVKQKKVDRSVRRTFNIKD